MLIVARMISFEGLILIPPLYGRCHRETIGAGRGGQGSTSPRSRAVSVRRGHLSGYGGATRRRIPEGKIAVDALIQTSLE
jgi:hypothetical protein